MAEAVGLILAAGYSSRMNAFKPLLDFGGMPLLQRQIRLFRRAGVEEVWVVTGHRREALASLLEEENVRPVFNERYDQGMFSSVRAGVEAAGAAGRPLFILPVDYPLIPPFMLQRQLEAYGEAGEGVVYSSFGDRKGHPPLVGPELLPGILESDGEGGLQAILRRSEKISYVMAWDDRVCLDTDTPADYERALARWQQKSVRERSVCDYLYEYLGTGEEVKAHCAAVGRAARLLAEALNAQGAPLDAERLYCAGLLHDIKKGTPRHDAAGAELLRSMDYDETAALIAPHMNLPAGEGLSEAAILYYADKITEGGQYLTLEERRRHAAGRGDKAPFFVKRLDDAARVEGLLREVLGDESFAAVMEDIHHG